MTAPPTQLFFPVQYCGELGQYMFCRVRPQKHMSKDDIFCGHYISLKHFFLHADTILKMHLNIFSTFLKDVCTKRSQKINGDIVQFVHSFFFLRLGTVLGEDRTVDASDQAHQTPLA
jgi:hypothetical protein